MRSFLRWYKWRAITYAHWEETVIKNADAQKPRIAHWIQHGKQPWQLRCALAPSVNVWTRRDSKVDFCVVDPGGGSTIQKSAENQAWFSHTKTTENHPWFSADFRVLEPPRISASSSSTQISTCPHPWVQHINVNLDPDVVPAPLVHHLLILQNTTEVQSNQ